MLAQSRPADNRGASQAAQANKAPDGKVYVKRNPIVSPFFDIDQAQKDVLAEDFELICLLCSNTPRSTLDTISAKFENILRSYKPVGMRKFRTQGLQMSAYDVIRVLQAHTDDGTKAHDIFHKSPLNVRHAFKAAKFQGKWANNYVGDITSVAYMTFNLYGEPFRRSAPLWWLNCVRDLTVSISRQVWRRVLNLGSNCAS